MISRLNPASVIVYSKGAATGRPVLRSPRRGLRPRKTIGKESHSEWNLAMVLWYGIGMVGRGFAWLCAAVELCLVCLVFNEEFCIRFIITRKWRN